MNPIISIEDIDKRKQGALAIRVSVYLICTTVRVPPASLTHGPQVSLQTNECFKATRARFVH